MCCIKIWLIIAWLNYIENYRKYSFFTISLLSGKSVIIYNLHWHGVGLDHKQVSIWQGGQTGQSPWTQKERGLPIALYMLGGGPFRWLCHGPGQSWQRPWSGYDMWGCCYDYVMVCRESDRSAAFHLFLLSWQHFAAGSLSVKYNNHGSHFSALAPNPRGGAHCPSHRQCSNQNPTLIGNRPT